MKFFSTRYQTQHGFFGEEVAARDREHAINLLFARGLGEVLDGEGRAKPYTESVLDAFDAGNFVAAAHGACQLLRLQNIPSEALAALGDNGLVHELIHMAVLPDEPVVTYRRFAIRQELAALELRIRPGLNSSNLSQDEQ